MSSLIAKGTSTSTIPPNPETASSGPPDAERTHSRDWVAAVLAFVVGIGCGVLQVFLADLSTTALVVTATSMTIGCAWPRRPWRWALLIALWIPAAVLIEWQRHPGRGMLFGSFAMLAPALVAAFGGSFMRKLVTELFRT